MHLVKVRFHDELSRLFDDNFNPSTSPVTELLRAGEDVVIDTSLEIHDLNRFTRKGAFPVPVLSILNDCCAAAGASLDQIHWITPVYQHQYKNKHVFNGTLEEYLNSRSSTIEYTSDIKYNFLSLNNYPRPHRRRLVDFLESSGISKKSIYSYNPRGIGNEKSVTIDSYFSNCDLVENLDCLPEAVWHETGVSIVSESLFDEQIFFPTEKTWKVFDKFHLPIFVAVPGFVQRIRDYGFDVFDDYIDHSYDMISNNDCRLEKIFGVIEYWSSLSTDCLIEIKNELKARLEYNHNKLHELISASILYRDQFLISLR